MERRAIYSEAVKQAQRLAAVHDPTGTMFNVGPVTRDEDGAVISVEALQRRREREEARKNGNNALLEITTGQKGNAIQRESASIEDQASNINPARVAQISTAKPEDPSVRKMSKTQQRKLAKYEPRPPPPKPVLPEGISIPEGEENWIDLWDLPDEELERRVLRAKKRKAAARKALRVKQKSGKVERRAARDEKRKVYRDLKHTWKSIKGKPRINLTECGGLTSLQRMRSDIRLS